MNSRKKIRIQPADVEIVANDPFKHDLFDRENSIKVLTNQLRNIESPCVISIDAEYGYGKTTFLKIWSQFLRDNNFVVVEFNAWETDASNDPFAALTAELMDRLNEFKDDAPKEKALEAFKKSTGELLRMSLPILVRIASSGMFDKDDIQPLASLLPEELAKNIGLLQSNQNVVNEFKNSLENTLGQLPWTDNGLPLIVMIDELDRCRPSYALESLEVAKHLFSVRGIVFVLAINHTQLPHSTKVVYGNDFDASGYLKRFFDIDFKLPSPSRKRYIKKLTETAGINEILSHDIDDAMTQEEKNIERINIKRLLCGFFSNSKLSHRQVAKSINRLSLVLGSCDEGEPVYGLSAAVVVMLRSIDFDKYQSFCQGEISDLDYANFIFKSSGAEKIRQDIEGFHFEITLIIGKFEISGMPISEWGWNESPLWDVYRCQIDKAINERNFAYEQFRHATNYDNHLNALISKLRNHQIPGLGFRKSIERVDMIFESFAPR